MTTARERLQQKFGTHSKLGGKGSMRRKKKSHRKPLPRKQNHFEKEYCALLNSINDSVTKLSPDEKLVWYSVCEEELIDYMIQLSSKDMSSTNRKWKQFSDKNIQQDVKNYSSKDYLQEHYEEFIHSYIVSSVICPKDDIYLSVTFRTDTYLFLSSIFSDRGYDNYRDCLESLREMIEKRSFLETEEDNTMESLNVNEQLELLGLSLHEIPSKSQLKKAYYRKSLEYHPDRHPNETDKYTTLFTQMKQAYQFCCQTYYSIQSSKQTKEIKSGEK